MSDTYFLTYEEMMDEIVVHEVDDETSRVKFVKSLRSYYKRFHSFTQRQIEKLLEIYEEIGNEDYMYHVMLKGD